VREKITMKRYSRRETLVLLPLVALSVQGCLGIGNNTNNTTDNFKTKATVGGKEVGVSEAAPFKGKIYLTLGRNLFVLNDQLQLKQLTSGMDVRDPAVSPDGKQIAFVQRFTDYADLLVMPSSGGKPQRLISGNGHYIPNGSLPPNTTFYWFGQPAWRDNKNLAFVSDLAKLNTPAGAGIDAFLLDPQVFQISIDDPQATPQLVATAHYGDGGDRDPAFRPGQTNQVIYTHYQYDTATSTHQIIQIELEDADAIANSPGAYQAGANETNPAVDLTPAINDLANMMPTWSPDGNHIAYIRRLSSTSMGLYVMSVPTTDVTKTPNDPATEKLALQPYAKSVQILTSEFVSQPVWSPDGTQIAYYTYNETFFDLWLVTVTKDAKTGQYKMKGTPQQLTHALGNLDADSRPFWTP
jgi:Tol biopolymer transport system component